MFTIPLIILVLKQKNIEIVHEFFVQKFAFEFFVQNIYSLFVTFILYSFIIFYTVVLSKIFSCFFNFDKSLA